MQKPSSQSKATKSSSSKVEDVYQKKTQIEHVLLRPDSYVGSVDSVTKDMWVWDAKQELIVNKTISYVPGLFKIFDEIIVNAADNLHRDRKMTMIKVTIDSNRNRITVWNNGKGIPIQMHAKEKVYVPELVFGHLLTSSNYDDSVKKVTGGRNGFGAKLTNIFSKKFTITTADSSNKKKYTQIFKNNLSEICAPKIDAYSPDAYDFTEIVFEPDLKRFKMQGGMDSDIISLLTKRVYDLAGVTPASVNVYLNGKKITGVKNFQSYVDLYFKDQAAEKIFKVYEAVGQRWEICASLSETGQFQQVSFVNSINTSRGGSHVELVANQIVDKVLTAIQKKHKKLDVKKPQVKQNLWLFVNSQIENPAFDSQTKETLTSNSRTFGSKCELSDNFLKKIVAGPITDSVVLNVQARQNAQLKRALGTGGKKKRQLFGIDKLEDANLAGSAQGSQCTLILTEGDSAKALAVAGLQIVGRDRFGVFPLKGKLMNVRDASTSQILANQELQHVIKIMGFYMGKTYTDLKDLRYGSIMIMTDQDHDGSHIKGLLINFLHHFWPSLLKIPGFLKEFVTPIIKANHGQTARSFFTIADYEFWLQQRGSKGLSGCKIKYYKGLGTSTTSEAKEYFRDIKNHIIGFKTLQAGQVDDDAINLAFNKSQADDRKDWLSNYNRKVCIDHTKCSISYKEFIDQELIHFSVADNHRSIPSVVDGLKPGQRKILYSCFKRLPSGSKKLSSDIKVAQLSGYVAEHSAYHHGEISLNMTIVGMAQDYVGSNNINILLPIGQFGTRGQGGKDFASCRYIFTNLNEQTRTLFPEEDGPVFNYLDEEGMSIEPDYYAPTIPMVLANGAEGIGTGWSTLIPQYSPLDLIDNLRAKLSQNRPFKRMNPWYRGFNGSVQLLKETNTYQFSGQYSYKLPDRLEITELPIKKWTRDFKKYLEELALKDEIDEIREYHLDNSVKFVLTVPNLKSLLAQEGGIEKKFKLTSTISANNMVLFDSESRIKRYANECLIMEEYFPVRLALYGKRKAHQLQVMRKDLQVFDNKCRFIEGVNANSIQLRDKSKIQIMAQLVDMNFSADRDISSKNQDDDNVASDSQSFNYLLNLPLYSLTREKIEELRAKIADKRKQIDQLERLSIEQLWMNDLDRFEKVYKRDLSNKGFSEKQNNQPSNENGHSITSYATEERKSIISQKEKPKIATALSKKQQESSSTSKRTVIQKQSSSDDSSIKEKKGKGGKSTTSSAVLPKKRSRKRQIEEESASSSSGSSSSEFSEDGERETIVKRQSSSRAYQIEAPKIDPWAKQQQKKDIPKESTQAQIKPSQNDGQKVVNGGTIASHREVKIVEKNEKKNLMHFFGQQETKPEVNQVPAYVQSTVINKPIQPQLQAQKMANAEPQQPQKLDEQEEPELTLRERLSKKFSNDANMISPLLATTKTENLTKQQQNPKDADENFRKQVSAANGQVNSDLSSVENEIREGKTTIQKELELLAASQGSSAKENNFTSCQLMKQQIGAIQKDIDEQTKKVAVDQDTKMLDESDGDIETVARPRRKMRILDDDSE